jgi:lysophospholipase L1-like esterase
MTVRIFDDHREFQGRIHMNRNTARVALSLVVTLVWVMPAVAAEIFPIRDGDKVVFWGDSITDNAFYTRTIEKYVRGRYPSMKADFVNLGWGGDNTSTVKRMERDLLPVNPTLVLIDLGMNDGGYKPYEDRTGDVYIAGMTELVDLIRTKTSARIILITPTPYEPGVRTDDQAKKLDAFYPQAIRKLSDRLVAFAKQKAIPVVDLNAAYGETIAKIKAKDPSFKFTGDSVHPNSVGQALMAFLILQGIGADGRILDLAIDAKAGKVVRSEGQTITELTNPKNGLVMTRKVSAFPFETSGNPAGIDFAPWYDTLNRNMLTVTGLSAPWYILTADDDGKPLKVLSKDELARGVNLSDLGIGLPEYKTAGFIASLVDEKHSARYTRWRRMLLPGVNSPYQFTTYLPETTETLYLADKAEMINTFLAGGKVSRPAYRLRLIPSAVKEIAKETMLIRASLKLQDAVTGTWGGKGTLTEENTASVRIWSLDYAFTDSWWAGIGLNLDNWAAAAPKDLSGYTTMLVTYEGPSEGNTLAVMMSSGAGKTEIKSETAEVGGSSKGWRTAEVPLRNLKNVTFDLTKVSTVVFSVGGAPSGKGMLRVKDVRLVVKE